MSKPFEYDKVKEEIGAGIGVGVAGLFDANELKGTRDAGEASKDATVGIGVGVAGLFDANELKGTRDAGEASKDAMDAIEGTIDAAIAGAEVAKFCGFKIDETKHFDPKANHFDPEVFGKYSIIKIGETYKEADKRVYDKAIRDTASDKFIKEIAEEQGVSVETLNKAITAQTETDTIGQAYLATNNTVTSNSMQTIAAVALYKEKMDRFDKYVENRIENLAMKDTNGFKQPITVMDSKYYFESLYNKDSYMESVYDDARASVEEYITARTAMDTVKDKLPKDIYTTTLNGLSEKYPAAKAVAENYPQSDEAYIARGQEIPDKQIENPVLLEPDFAQQPGCTPGHPHHCGPESLGDPNHPWLVCKDLGDSAGWATSKVNVKDTIDNKDVVDTAVQKVSAVRNLNEREIPDFESAIEGTDATKDMSLE